MASETLAIIDLGTNTFHLLIVKIDERDDFSIQEKYKIPVKLGEGGITSGKISKASYERGINAMKRFRKMIDSQKASRVFAFATSAIRSAENGKEFILDVKEQAKIDIKVINGNEEAALIFEGVKNGVQLPYEKDTLILDIGGGSVEFIVTRENRPLLMRSLDIGAARLLEIISPSNPMKKSELERTQSYLHSKMDELIKELRLFDLNLLVGSSGSFETIASIIAHANRDFLAADNLNSYEFGAVAFNKLHKRLIKSSRSDRLNIPGMEAMRVDMMVMASIIIDFLVRELGIRNISTSLFALKEGILYHYISEKKERLNYLIGNTERSLRAKAIRNLGKKFGVDENHGLKVSEIATRIFQQLMPLHPFGKNEAEILKYACLLHDIGHFVNRSGHHKHGQYIIMNSGLSGFSNDELLILGNVVRYHRKSLPTRDHFHYKVLRDRHRYMVRVLAGILRIADNLDRGHRNIVMDVKVEISSSRILLHVISKEPADIEIISAEAQTQMLSLVLETPVHLQQA